jgi:hypothetical protein
VRVIGEEDSEKGNQGTVKAQTGAELSVEDGVVVLALQGKE